MSITPAPSLLPIYTWLNDAQHRRSALVMIRQCLSGGWSISDEDRGRIRSALEALKSRGNLRGRESRSIDQTLALVEASVRPAIG